MNTQQKALILFRIDKEQKVCEILNSELDVERQRKKIISEDATLGSVTKIGRDYGLFEVINIWGKYRDFDNFLIRLVQDFGFYDLDENALLIGHIDENGFLWTDYAKFIDDKFPKV